MATGTPGDEGGRTLPLPDEAATARLGETLALALTAGDVVYLSGDLGAGKSTLARALLRTAAGDPFLEVPSPTFTLVQAYDGLSFGQALHADLYRLEDPDEVEELGLAEGLDAGAVLVEWPERGGGVLPAPSLRVLLAQGDGPGRTARIEGTQAAMGRVERSLAIRRFLDARAWHDAERRPLTGDASSRAYETLHREGADGHPPILMNAPAQPDGPPVRDGKPYSRIAHLAEDVSAFVAVGRLLAQAGMRVPALHAADLEAGLLVLENLGPHGILDEHGRPVPERYLACADALARLHRTPLDRFTAPVSLGAGRAHEVPAFDAGVAGIEVELWADWYAPHLLGRPLSQGEREDFLSAWQPLLDEIAATRETLVLRDFHSPNVIWDPHAQGTDRVGLIDFQDALIGPAAYDLASIAFDARVDVPEALSEAMIERYATARGAGLDRTALKRMVAILTAQRATKILGIFVRLSRRDGKHGYLAHLPRMERILNTALAHPALAAYRSFLEGLPKR